MNLSRSLAISATALLAAGLWIAPVADPPLGSASAQTAPAAEVGEEEIAAFARATLSMAALRESYVARIEAAESEAEQQALIEEGNAAMVTAIEEEPGIDLDRYVQINEAAQADAGLNARILETLQAVDAEG